MPVEGAEEPLSRRLLDGLGRGALWSLAVNGTLFVGGQTAAVMPYGNRLLLEMGIFAAPFILAALVSLALAPVALLFSAWRPKAARITAAAAGYVAVFLLSMTAAQSLRTRAFLALADRSRPLVEAIGNYEAKRGAPPPTLDALVPEFLPEVPKTGMGAYPDYMYGVSTGTLQMFQPTPWVLYVNAPSGGINFDMFFYLPKRDYKDRVGGDPVQRIGDWGYLHE